MNDVYRTALLMDKRIECTHPVRVNVPDPDKLMSIFDGISYGKGSSFLKQMYNMIGHEVMKKGLHIYFDKH